MSRTLQPDWKDPLTYGVIIAVIILICAGLSGCSSRAAPPRAGTAKAPTIEAPKTSKQAGTREDDLRADIEMLQRELDRAEADTARLKKREEQARWENLARVIQIAAAIAMLGGVALTVLGFFNPALRPLRLIAGLGAGAAAVVFGLAGYLPLAVPWLGPIALGLTAVGAAWLVWKLHRTGNAATGAIDVANILKEHVNPDMSRDLRIAFQREAAGNRAGAINEIRKAMQQ